MQINGSSGSMAPSVSNQSVSINQTEKTDSVSIAMASEQVSQDSQVLTDYPQAESKHTVSLISELSPAQQQDLVLLQQRFPDLADSLESMTRGPSPILLKQDAQGQTILSQLSTLSQAKGVYPEISTQAVTKQLISRLADRSEIFQGPQFTCGSAAIQNYMTANDPAEMVHIMKNLATQGKAKLRDGSSIKLPADTRDYLKDQPKYLFNNGKDHDKRDLSDVLFQSAVMQDISLFGGDRAWKTKASDNLLDKGLKALVQLTDWADYNAKKDDVGLKTKFAGNGGGNPFLIEPLIESMTGKPFERDSMLSLNKILGNKSAYLNAVSAVKRGEHELITLLKSPMHYVVLTDFDAKNQTVTYLSTGTYHKNSAESSITAYETVPLQDFLKNCGALYGPE